MKRYKWIISLIALFFVTLWTGTFAQSNTQNLYVSVADLNAQTIQTVKKGTRLKDILSIIEKMYDVHIFYESSLVANKKISQQKVLNFRRGLFGILDNVLAEFNFTFKKIATRTLGIVPKSPTPQIEINAFTITGKVTDAKTGEALIGVNIFVIGTQRGTSTDKDGKYSIAVNNGATDSLRFSYVGYKTKKVKVNNRETLNIVLEQNIAALGDVVVTGIVERDKRSFTGAVKTITHDELKETSPNNILEAIKTQDPSLVEIENNVAGDDPNSTPNLEIRGRTSTSQASLENQFGGNPNQPLFILDGFETTLQTVADLDIDRVKSISILKDAASTALYGAKAANGVIVIETREPEAGDVRVSYSGDMTISDPDLSSYNLMNARQKLEFEKKSGLYEYTGDYASTILENDSLYNARLRLVQEGNNYDWANQPLRTGVIQRHNVYVEGGNADLRYGVGVNYQDNNGVIQGSGRNTWGGDLNLIYSNNKLDINNKLGINGFKSTESPYGSFSDYTRANPYYTPRNSEGVITKFLDQTTVYNDNVFDESFTAPNPLYDARLNSSDNSTMLNINENLQAKYTFNPTMRMEGGFQLVSGNQERIAFTSPLDTQFNNADRLERGRYTNVQTNNFSYRGDITFTYADVFADKHRLTSNARVKVTNEEFSRYRTTAVGFPTGSNGDPSFAFNYAPDESPETAEQTIRRNNLLASINYGYDRRYLFDATYRLDGSTSFGSANRYTNYWSVGAGWNIYNEKFFTSDNLLRLKGSYGVTGNENFGNIASVSVFDYESDTNIFGQGVGLRSYGNPNLNFQKTTSANISLEFGLFNNGLTGTVSAFRNLTDPLVVIVDQPSSTGVHGYATNAGNLNTRGLEADINFRLINRASDNIVWSIGVNGSLVRSEYGNFGRLNESLNENAIANSSLIRYQNGRSPDDLYALRSAGIDPATGDEVFVKPNGELTFESLGKYEQIVGNDRPDVKGYISTRINYKRFTLNANLRYSFGADVFNTVLYNKVENISYGDLRFNQDARALTDRWQEPGDVAKFKSIKDQSFTPISSRFVQRENFIKGESIRLGYRVTSAQWLDKVGLNSFRFSIYTSDFFRASSVRVERGTAYPFTRSFSTSIDISF